MTSLFTARRDQQPTRRRTTARSSVRSGTTRKPTGSQAAARTNRRPVAPASTGRRIPAATRASRSNAEATKTRRATLKATAPGDGLAAGVTLLTLALTLFGLVMVLSAASVADLHDENRATPFYHFTKQATWAGLGAIGFVVASRVPYPVLRRLKTVGLGVCVLMLGALLVPGVGVNVNGATRWLAIGPIQIQPSEFAKLAMVVFVADLLARRERLMHRPEATVRPIMTVLVIMSALLLVQPKLGSAIVLAMVAFCLLFVAGASIRSLVPWLGLMVAGAGVMAWFAEYRRNRLFAFLDPWADPLGNGLQTIQAHVGIASGGLLGTGLGAGRAKWGFLPYPHSDFIFAVVAEEVGLIGASALIAGFVLLAVLGFRAATEAPDRFGMLLAAGLTCWLVGQAFLNIGMVVGVLPVTGEPLPFVSAGGSSLLTTLVAAGLLVNVARHGRKPSQ